MGKSTTSNNEIIPWIYFKFIMVEWKNMSKLTILLCYSCDTDNNPNLSIFVRECILKFVCIISILMLLYSVIKYCSEEKHINT